MSKSDGSGLSSDHLVHAAPVISNTLADLCTAIICHGHMPEALSNCILVPILKGQKDPTKSDNYRPITFAPTLSKVIEQALILQYSEFFFTSDLQFGFKKVSLHRYVLACLRTQCLAISIACLQFLVVFLMPLRRSIL